MCVHARLAPDILSNFACSGYFSTRTTISAANIRKYCLFMARCSSIASNPVLQVVIQRLIPRGDRAVAVVVGGLVDNPQPTKRRGGLRQSQRSVLLETKSRRCVFKVCIHEYEGRQAETDALARRSGSVSLLDSQACVVRHQTPNSGATHDGKELRMSA